MKIESKFNKGRYVWWYCFSSEQPMQGVIKKVTIEAHPNSMPYIEYTLAIKNELFFIEESVLSASKEECLGKRKST